MLSSFFGTIFLILLFRFVTPQYDKQEVKLCVTQETNDAKPIKFECDVANPLACNRKLLEICNFRNGTYRCECPPNHSRTPDGRCIVVNECFEQRLNECSEDADCTDTLESYICTCKQGFTDFSPQPQAKPGRVCKQQVNKCADPTKYGVNCDPNASCRDTKETPESYQCICKSGFYDVSERFGLPAGRRCDKAVDPCESGQNDCSKNASCSSNKGVYTCQCKSGFSDLSPNKHYPGRDCRITTGTETTGPPGQKCEPKADISCPAVTDRCATSNDCDVNANCINRPGSYDCECKAGYTDISPDTNKRGRKCILPENKCSSRDKNDCSPFSQCFPQFNDYRCQCEPGYLDISSQSGKLPGRVCVHEKNECSSSQLNSCDENADCVKKPGGYACLCQKGYYDVSGQANLPPGRVCTLATNCPSQPTDLIFLIDGSGSIGSNVFHNDVLRFVSEFISLFTIASDQTRVGVIQFSDLIRKEFDLNQYANAQSLQNAVKNIQYLMGLTRTGAAIDFMMSDGFTTNHGARSGDPTVKRVTIVITDGRAQDNVIEPANKARAAGVKLFAVGVTDHILESQLEEIAGNKSGVFIVGSFKDLNTRLRAVIQKELCPPAPPVTPVCPGCDPSRNYICQDNKCICPAGFCEDPANKLCGAQLCNPDLSFTCPYPMVCKETPFKNYRCACPKDFSCNLSDGSCVTTTPVVCPPNQKVNPSTGKCEGCNPPCDSNKNQFCLTDYKNQLYCGCKDKYTLDPVTQVCTINECTTGLANCSQFANCTNTLESFFCTCWPGYKDNSPGKFLGTVCDKIENVCETGKHNCSKSAICIPDSLGGFTCRCKDGFVDMFPPIPGRICEERVNECSDPSKNNCSKNADCFDLDVGYRCVCKSGYQDIKSNEQPGRFCVIDPCQDASKNDCWLKRCRVVDLSTGQFTCEPCPNGYIDADSSRPGRNCQTKVQPCADSKRNTCDPNAYCVGVEGRNDEYTCKCRDGYLDVSTDVINKPGRKCEIIKNPCFDATINDCDTNAVCTDLKNNKYNCTCKQGYKDKSTDPAKPGRKCRRLINECAVPQLNNCSAHAKCQDLEDGFTCVCEENYVDKSDPGLPGRKCVFVPDPCSSPSLNECDIHAKCTKIDDGYKCECLPPYREDSTNPALPGRKCIYDGCNSKSINTCGAHAKCVNGDGYINCVCEDGFVDEDPLRPGTKCIPEPLCGNKKCNKSLGLQCDTKQNVCVCKEGYAQKDENSKCTEVVPISLYLWVVRRNQNIYTYSPENSDLTNPRTKEIVNMFIDGVGKTYASTPLANSYVISKIREIQNPAGRNPNWNRGLWVEFTGFFDKSTAPDDYAAWRTLVDTIKNKYNFSVGGTELFINEYQLPFACYKNDCDKNANCTEISPTSYTCVCFPNFIDEDKNNPGRKCTVVTTLPPTTKPLCGSQICKDYAGEVCVDNRCVCAKGKARRDPNDECTPYDHIVYIPILVVNSGTKPIDYNPNYGDKNSVEYRELIPPYVKNVDQTLSTTVVYPKVIECGVETIYKPGSRFPGFDKGVLINSTFAVRPGTSDKELCEQLKKAIKDNRNLLGFSQMRVDENFDICNPSLPPPTQPGPPTPSTPPTPPTPTTPTTPQIIVCGDVTCKLGQFCINGRCVDCPKGQWKKDGVCVDVVEFEMPLHIIRRYETTIVYNTSYSDKESPVHKECIDWLTVGIPSAYDKTSLGNRVAGVEIHELSKPPSGEQGFISEFTVYFVKQNAPNESEAFNQLIRSIRDNFNYSVGGTPLFINDKAPCLYNPRVPCAKCPDGTVDLDPFLPGMRCVTDLCANNNCDKNAKCVPTSSGKFTCVCKRGYANNATSPDEPVKCVEDFCSDFPDCPKNNGTCINYPEQSYCQCNKTFVDLRKLVPELGRRRQCHDDAFCLLDIDVNYCCLQLHNCHPTSQCVRLPTGGYQCRCQGSIIQDNEACTNVFPTANPIAREELCEYCNHHGTCIGSGQVVCQCETWYTGETCATDVRIILAIIFAIIFFLLTLCCLIYYCLKCRCFKRRTAYQEMASSADGMSQMVSGKESEIYHDFSIPRARLKEGGEAASLSAVAGAGAGAGAGAFSEDRERRQRSLERYLERGGATSERLPGDTEAYTDVVQRVRRRGLDGYESGSDVSSEGSWNEQYERRVTTDYKKSETTKTTAAGDATAEFRVFPPKQLGIEGGEHLRAGTSRHTATSSTRYEEVEDDALSEGGTSVGTGTTDESIVGGDTYDKRTLVKRAHEFAPGRGSEKFTTEMKTTTKSGETKYI